MATRTDRAIDARGLRCPWPVLRAARALRERQGAVRILADDPAAAGELAALAAARGCGFSRLDDNLFEIGEVPEL